MDMLFFDKLKKICGAFGFNQRGEAFFRLIGDGVLQVIKCKHQRNLGGEIISIGLFSMYGYLQPQWFTASACITRYNITSCYYQNNMPLVFAVPIQTQLDMLSSQVLPWLDSIDTQKKLISAITKLDNRWNDRLKIGPYLACGELNHAKKVARELLTQYDFGRTGRIQYHEDPNGLLILKREQGGNDPQALLEMIDRGDPEEINAYLKENYMRNIEYAKFCTKNKGNI